VVEGPTLLLGPHFHYSNLQGTLEEEVPPTLLLFLLPLPVEEEVVLRTQHF